MDIPYITIRFVYLIVQFDALHVSYSHAVRLFQTNLYYNDHPYYIYLMIYC